MLAIISKPNRAQLLKVIGQLQTMVGQVKGIHQNDRDVDRYENVQTILAEAFDLCVLARSFDPAPIHRCQQNIDNRIQDPR